MTKTKKITHTDADAARCALDKQLSSLRPGNGFTVASESDRQDVLRRAKILYDLGIIKFAVVTKSDGQGGFKVAAL